MSTGDLTSLFSYIMSLLMSLMMLSMVIVMISMSLASVRRISEVLDETPDLKDPEQPVTEVADGRIDFNHVNFSYKHGSGKNALSDIDLHIKSGETIGVIGGTGCGKSSLVNLICRLLRCGRGVRLRRRSGRAKLRHGGSAKSGFRGPAEKYPCSPAPSWITCAGAIPTPRRKNVKGPVRRPAPTSSSTACPTDTIRSSPGAAPMCPADRSSICALPGPC